MQLDNQSLSGEYLFLVNELGEFFELLQVANTLKRKTAARCLFVFARDDYAALNAHAAIADSRGHRAISMSYADLHRLRWEGQFSERSKSGYLPENVWRKRIDRFWALKLAIVVSYTIIFYLFVLALLPVLFVVASLSLIYWFSRGKTDRIFRFVKSLAPLVVLPITYRRYTHWRHHGRMLIRIAQPDLIVMGQYFAGSYNSVLISTHPNLPAVVVPFAMGTTREISESLYDNKSHHLPAGFLGRMIYALYPSWINTYKGRRLMRLTIDEIIALEAIGLREQHPWVPNCGPATLLCLSQENLEYYKSIGMPTERLRNTGGLWNDLLDVAVPRRDRDVSALDGILQSIRHNRFQQIIAKRIGFKIPALDLHNIDSRDLLEALGQCRETIERNDLVIDRMVTDIEQKQRLYRQRIAIEISKIGAKARAESRRVRKGPYRRILVSWPTNQYPRRAWSFETYADYCAYLLNFLAHIQANWNVDILVSLHPTLTKILTSETFEKKDLTLISWPLIDYIHTVDIFVANVSSTIFWTVQCGIPTINFDTYRYGYEEFKAAGCESVEVPRDFEKVLIRMLSDTSFYDEVRDRIIARRGFWTHPEGGSEERILKALSSQIDNMAQ